MSCLRNLIRKPCLRLPLMLEAGGAKARWGEEVGLGLGPIRPLKGLYLNQVRGFSSGRYYGKRMVKLLEDVKRSNSAILRQNKVFQASLAVQCHQLEKSNDQGQIMILLQQRIVRALEAKLPKKVVVKSLNQDDPWTAKRFFVAAQKARRLREHFRKDKADNGKEEDIFINGLHNLLNDEDFIFVVGEVRSFVSSAYHLSAKVVIWTGQKISKENVDDTLEKIRIGLNKMLKSNYVKGCLVSLFIIGAVYVGYHWYPCVRSLM